MSASKPLLVGQAPGPNTDPRWPLAPLPATSAGGRLAALMGLSPKEYLRTFQRVNLIREFPGRWRRDDVFPKKMGRVAAEAMTPLLEGRLVVLVGRNVARCFGLPEEHPFHELDWHRPGRFWCAVVPHPSGRNRWYNEPARRAEAEAFWRRLLEADREGLSFPDPRSTISPVNTREKETTHEVLHCK